MEGASEGKYVLVVREDKARRWSQENGSCSRQPRASGWDGSGAEGDVHLDWAHTPGRCPHQVSLENLVPKVGRGCRTKGLTSEWEGGASHH